MASSTTTSASSAVTLSRLPSPTTFQTAFRLGINEDKPIYGDYWQSSLDGKAFIAIKPNKEKFLVLSRVEFTSPIQKIFSNEEEYIIMTENSIYIVAKTIPLKPIRDNNMGNSSA